MSIGGSILVGNKNIDGNFVEDRNEQHFEGLDFRIKIETLPNEDYSARLFFINKNDDNEIPIPDGIVCKDVTLRNEVIKYPLPLTNYFLINHPLKYQITYKGILPDNEADRPITMEVDPEIDEVRLLIDQINVNNDNIITAKSYIEIDSHLGTEMLDDDEIIATSAVVFEGVKRKICATVYP
ncbi:12418_t:CDS:2 [Entrophospora sp. SA101]|nr:12418_t:CDS:2 [Entrophospora sp. SA101]